MRARRVFAFEVKKLGGGAGELAVLLLLIRDQVLRYACLSLTPYCYRSRNFHLILPNVSSIRTIGLNYKSQPSACARQHRHFCPTLLCCYYTILFLSSFGCPTELTSTLHNASLSVCTRVCRRCRPGVRRRHLRRRRRLRLRIKRLHAQLFVVRRIRLRVEPLHVQLPDIRRIRGGGALHDLCGGRPCRAQERRGGAHLHHCVRDAPIRPRLRLALQLRLGSEEVDALAAVSQATIDDGDDADHKRCSSSNCRDCVVTCGSAKLKTLLDQNLPKRNHLHGDTSPNNRCCFFAM